MAGDVTQPNDSGGAGAVAPAPRLSLSLSASDREALLILAGVIVVSVGLRFLTYDPVADGDHTRYVKTALFGGAAAAVVWLLMRIQTGARSLIPLLAAAAVLLSGDAVHYVRRLNPITRGGPVQEVQTTFTEDTAARRQWDFEITGSGKARFDQGALVLESPPSSTAYIQGQLGPTPDARVNWWLPVGLAERERSERLSWRATVNRTRGYYVVSEMRRLVIQVVSYGIHITYPDDQNVNQGTEIQHPVGSDGQPHDWEILRDPARIRLLIDGKEIWSATQREALGMIKLGETRVDPEHGGSMRLERASYESFLER
jgi:hypothetical protein